MSLEVTPLPWLVSLVVNLGFGIILDFDERLFIGIFKEPVNYG